MEISDPLAHLPSGSFQANGGWPLKVFHCDRKIAAGSIHHAQDPRVKGQILTDLDGQYRPQASELMGVRA